MGAREDILGNLDFSCRLAQRRRQESSARHFPLVFDELVCRAKRGGCMQSLDQTDASGATEEPAPNLVGDGRLNGGSNHLLQNLLHALQAMRAGDFSVRMRGDDGGIEGKIVDTFNEIVGANQRMAEQLLRVGQVVGKEGKTRQRVKLGMSLGAWDGIETS